MAQTDDDFDHTDVGNTIGGAVGGVGALVMVVAITLLILFAYCCRVRLCVPQEFLPVVSQWAAWVAELLKVVAVLFILGAIANHNWITQYVVGGTSDFSSSTQIGLFSLCQCTNLDIPVNRVSVQMTPDRDRLRRSAIVLLVFAFVLSLGLLWLYTRVLNGTVVSRKYLSLGAWLNILIAFFAMYAFAAGATIYQDIISTDSKLLPHSPAADLAYNGSHLAEGFAFAVLASMIAVVCSILGCLAHRSRVIPLLVVIFTYFNIMLMLVSLISSRWFVVPTEGDVENGRLEAGLFQICGSCHEFTDLERASAPVLLSTAHKAERNSTTAFLFFAFFIVLGVNVSSLVSNFARRGLLPEKVGRIAHPLLLLIAGVFLLFALSIFGGLYGDLIAQFHAQYDPQNSTWYLPVGPGYGFVVAALFACMFAAFLEILAVNGGAADGQHEPAQDRAGYQPILQRDPEAPAASGSGGGDGASAYPTSNGGSGGSANTSAGPGTSYGSVPF